MSAAEDPQSRIWELLYARIRDLLRRFGTEDSRGRADFWVEDENWGYQQQKVYINNLDLLKPPVIKLLQELLVEFPDWEIVIAVSVRGSGAAWPDMGLTIRAHEIIDGLQRQYFPGEFRNIEYEGSRSGTERD